MASLEEVRRKVRFFQSRGQLRAWFSRHHGSATELWIGYFKRGVDRAGVSYEDAVEEALCVGWVDGQVRSLDALRYANRYTPRRPGSRWSRTNVRKVRVLRREGRMRPTGLAAFAARSGADRRGYSYEERPTDLGRTLRALFLTDGGGWRFFQAQSPSYRRAATFWVMSARREETRRRRLLILRDASARGRRVDLLAPGARHGAVTAAA